MRRLVILAGPIGSGKSTTADLLTRSLALRGLATAAVDLDDVAFMQRGGVVDVDEFWRRGAVATAAVVRAWFDLGADIVVAHGPFFESGGYSVLVGFQEADIVVTHVLLRVSYDTALTRVSLDVDRAISRDPEFLRQTHERFRDLEATLPEPDFVYDTEALTAQAITDDLVGVVIGNRQ